MKHLSRKTYSIILLVMILSIIYYKGFIYIPVYQDGELFIGEWVFREANKGSIIGNPNFEPSFIEVAADSFAEHFEQASEQLGYSHTIEEVDLREGRRFKTAFLINKLYYLDYDEGFLIMDAGPYKDDIEGFNEVFNTLLLTLDPEVSIGEVSTFLKASDTIEFLDYNALYVSAKVGFRFYDEEGYQVHVEDMRMGH